MFQGYVEKFLDYELAGDPFKMPPFLHGLTEYIELPATSWPRTIVVNAVIVPL